MRDYDELVKRLKQSDDNCNAEHNECPAECDCPGYTIFLDAADAIEELVAMRNVLKSRLAQLEKAEYESGDCAETYKSGFLVGKRQGAIELLREILGIDVDDPPKEVE